MPPKGKAVAAPNKKTDAKKKEKIIEDKTFGLKNKKGNKQQKYIKTVQHQVNSGGPPKKGPRDPLVGPEKVDRKKLAQAELNALFKPVEQKVPRGVDAKSMLCAFFKQGQCSKGDKCKFSHDLNIGRKGEKRSLYDDFRAEDEKDKGMEDWDEQKLEEVVNQKHGELNKGMPATTIICKFFLEAVENNKYGWFWECPNGGKNCHYKHALPPGFVLKKDRRKVNIEDMISLEDLIERERASMSSANLTKVTLESFLKWKEKKKREKKDKAVAAKEKKLADYTAGKGFGISGREMFEFNPAMVNADDEEEADIDMTLYKRDYSEDEEDDYDGPVREINLENLADEARENDGSGTHTTGAGRTTGPRAQAMAEKPKDEAQKMDVAGAADPTSETEAVTMNGDALAGDTPIDENLFDGEDLDLVEEELDTLELQD